MWFKRLCLKNVGPHRDLDLTLKRGAIGIFGPNGSGKSTILDLMYSTITNDFGRFDGVKLDCIHNRASEREESSIYAEIEHNNLQIGLYRGLRPAKHELVITGEAKALTNAERIQEKLTEVLGVERKLLDIYVFKRQDQIYDFLAATPAERAKAYQTLCRTEVCEAIWTLLGEALNQDTELHTEIIDNSDELAGEISKHKDAITELEQEKEDSAKLLLNTKSQDSAEEILRRQQRVEDLLGERDDAAAEEKSTEIKLGEGKETKDKRDARVKRLTEEWSELEEVAEPARAALKNWEQYDKNQNRRRKLCEEWSDLQEEDKERTVPGPAPSQGLSQADLVKDRSRKEQELEKAQETLETFATKGTTACPTCGTSVSSLKDYLQEQKKLVQQLPAAIKDLSKQLDGLEEYQKAVRKYETWKEGYQARKRANNEAREAMKELKEPEGDRAELETQIQQASEKKEELDKAKRFAEKSMQEVAEIQAAHTAAKRRLRDIDAGVEANRERPERVEKAKARLEEHRQAQAAIAHVEGRMRGSKELLEKAEEELRRLRIKLKRSKRLRGMANVVSKARDVLHRDRLPRRVAQSNLARMEGYINEGLGLFGDPFWIEADEALSFLAHKPGFPPHSAGRLSGGQKVVLAIAFWNAVASLWRAEVGMLALDEPTANLDEANRAYLGEALTRLTAQVRGKRQILITTHADNLRSCFDQVIDLGVQSK
ncbi:MAG: SMC family ATPase [Acidobacteria bacterium]|nr:SMC family ATPase [Acidobacteriota bacterium]